ncbi:glycoside hydrolase family 2 TIM barrel-domain containing protein [Chitinophaga niastensis]|nr:glycoside hydrolase family 2 TIM barrel-domain containing protein [Chitinophaga niastensis]
MKYCLLIICFFAFFISPLVSSAQDKTREVLNFNTNWAFHRGDVKGAENISFDDKDWSAVSIPHVMRIEKKHNGGNNVYQGIGWYRRYFRLPAACMHKRITLCFDGVQMNSVIYLNGKKIKEHAGGYMGFVADISDAVSFDKDNVLAVWVSNTDDPQTPPGKPQSKLDFNYFGGIYRNVSLVITNQLFISHPLEADKTAGGGVFVTYPAVSKSAADARIKTNIINTGNTPVSTTLVSRLVDKNGMVVADAVSHETIEHGSDKDFQQTLTVSHPQLWHPDHPYLYKLISLVYKDNTVIDSLITYTGIRNLSFRADGFYLNGDKLYLRGANRHQAYEYIGDAAADRMQYLDAAQLKRGGFNAVRAAHYPQSPAFLDACDSLGLLVIECEPGWQFFSKDSLFTERTYRDIREMIRRDRNHPSVFLWETSLNESPTPEAWMQKAVQVAYAEMPGHQMFVADDFNGRSKKYYDVSYKVINEDGSDPMPSQPFLTREWGDTWMADVAKENSLRAGRMFTEKGLINQCILRQNALNGETSEAAGGYWDHGGLDANTRIGGYFVWSYNDYTRGSDPVTAFSGVVDLDRYEKFGYYQLKAMQDAHNPAYGPMVYIAGYNNQPSLDSAIMVFSNCDAVRLYRNNKLLGEITRQQNAGTAPFVAAKGGSPFFLFHTGKYEAGTLKAVGLMYGHTSCIHTVNTPLPPDHLEIIIPSCTTPPLADGSDMTPFYVKVCDKNGTLVSNKSAGQSYAINISVSGAGALIGGNIPAAGISLQQTEGGIAYGIIRHSSAAGKIIIHAGGKGFTPATKTITTVAATIAYVADGTHPHWIDEHKKTTAIYYADTTAADHHLPEIKLSDKEIIITPATHPENIQQIIDNNTATGWIAGSSNFPLSITIDLKDQYHINDSRIVWGKDSDWYIYSIAVSANGQDWITAKSAERASGQDYKPVSLNQANVRYVRFLITGIQPESSKVAVREIQLYGQLQLKK